ncbi:MAG: hypothetical protein GTO18_08545 [Anaerolineales bacterium]|nr:hypothetical protein [Anaerolineales bacterium]
MPFPVWFLIACSFFYFSFMFWRYSNTPMRYFTLRKSRTYADGPDELGVEDRSEFLRDINGYLDSINKQIKTRYRIGSLGFLIAGLTAILAGLSIWL